MPKKIRTKKKSMEKPPRPATTGREAVSEFATLRTLIGEYRDAAVAESWKGGGDPAEMPVFEALLKLAETKLDAHIERMERGYFV